MSLLLILTAIIMTNPIMKNLTRHNSIIILYYKSSTLIFRYSIAKTITITTTTTTTILKQNCFRYVRVEVTLKFQIPYKALSWYSNINYSSIKLISLFAIIRFYK